MSFEDSNYYDCNKKDKISIEPRLLEYINKKKYFMENSIESETLEKDYNISEYDKLRIKAHLKGTRDKNLRFQDYVDTSQAYFPSELLKKDPRFDRIKKKQQKNKDAQLQRHNYGNISNEFDMYRNDRPFASAFGDDFTESKFHPREWFKNSRDIDIDNHYQQESPSVRRSSNKYKDFNEINTYTHPNQKSKYNGYLRDEIQNDHSLDNILASFNDINYNYNRTEQRENEFDYDYGTIRPNVRSKKSYTHNSHNNMPYMGDMRGNPNTEAENFVKFGSLTRGTKSNGYPNPVEHYFDYISHDIQDPRHVVMERGVPSRSLNRERNRNTR